ncbi:MAG TPA: hypothetical protein VF491_05955 [Vicinamibacterales bacterium]|jgi:hypothetical protein
MSDTRRRAFLGYCAFAGVSSTVFPEVLLAQIKPGTKAIAVGTIREAARLAGLEWSDAERWVLARTHHFRPPCIKGTCHDYPRAWIGR